MSNSMTQEFQVFHTFSHVPLNYEGNRNTVLFDLQKRQGCKFPLLIIKFENSIESFGSLPAVFRNHQSDVSFAELQQIKSRTCLDISVGRKLPALLGEWSPSCHVASAAN